MTLKGRVSPFGNPRIKACSQLPTAYRSVPRPSSPLGAKASTRCPCQTLDRFSHKPIQTRPKHPPRANAQSRYKEQSPDETMTAVKSLAFLSPAIQASKSRLPLEKTQTPRQPAGSPIHISNNPRPDDLATRRNPHTAKPPKPQKSKGRKTQTPKRAKLLSQDAEAFALSANTGPRHLPGSGSPPAVVPLARRPHYVGRRKWPQVAQSAVGQTKTNHPEPAGRRMVEPDGIEPTT